MESAYKAIESRTVPIEKKQKGGALLIAGAYIDKVHGLTDKGETLERIELIKKFEAGDLTLKQLNEVW